MIITDSTKPADIKTPQDYIDYLDYFKQLDPVGYFALMALLDTPIGESTIKSLIAAKKFDLQIRETGDYSSSSYSGQLVYLSGEEKFGFVIGQNKYGFSTIATMLIHELGHILNDNYSEQQVIENYENPYRAAMGYDIRTGYRGNNEWMPYTIQKTSNDVPLQWNYYNGGKSGTANGSYTYISHKNSESFYVTVVGNDNNDSFDMGIGNDTLYGEGGNDTLNGGEGNDYLEGGEGIDELRGGADEDILWGGGDDDALYGDSEHDILYGDTGSDVLSGGRGSDELYGGEGDDILIGNDGYGSSDTQSDEMHGGSGFDTYITSMGDIISDDNNKGMVLFNGIDLTGTKKKMEGGELYEDDDFIYQESGSTLIVTTKGGGGELTIENWNSQTKEALGIKLQDSENIEVSVDNAVAFEAEEMMRIAVSLQRELLENETLIVDLGYYTPIYKYELTGKTINVSGGKYYDSYTGTWSVQEAYSYPETRRVQTGEQFNKVGDVTFEPGDQVKTFTYTWTDDDFLGIHTGRPNPLPLVPKTNEDTSHYSDDIKVIAMNSGTETIIDDDEAGRYDPLVLDTNHDGFISTTPLTGSTTYFDITGDGLRERIGWVSGEDALLALDKNENGQIDGIDEIFGNLKESGFEELKRLIDFNRDNKIDRKDELYNQLQLWHDYNQDAMVQEGELTSLSDEGVTSIDLNYVSTRIEIEGNLLTEASKYSTDGGTKELVADIQLATDVADTKVDINDIPNFTIDPITHLLPQLRGSGLVYDSFIRYNMDPEFKAIAVANNPIHRKVA